MNKTKIYVFLVILGLLVAFFAYQEHRIALKDEKLIKLSEKLSTTEIERDGLKQEIVKYNGDTKIYRAQIQNLQEKVKKYEDYEAWGSLVVHPAMVDWLLELQQIKRKNSN